ncbi:MAG: rhodanese-like domain-containing protein [Stackebrandtia sp.]
MVTIIERDELKAAIDAKRVTVVDALGGEYYAKQHLPGAIALVEGEVVTRAADLLPDTSAAIVTYCSNPACPNSGNVAKRLTALGYSNVRKYRDGIEDWVEAGLPVEGA